MWLLLNLWSLIAVFTAHQFLHKCTLEDWIQRLGEQLYCAHSIKLAPKFSTCQTKELYSWKITQENLLDIEKNIRHVMNRCRQAIEWLSLQIEMTHCSGLWEVGSPVHLEGTKWERPILIFFTWLFLFQFRYGLWLLMQTLMALLEECPTVLLAPFFNLWRSLDISFHNQFLFCSDTPIQTALTQLLIKLLLYLSIL